MRKARIRVCLLLSFLMLATVLAPYFGWEVAPSLSVHAESAPLDGDIHEVHERSGPADQGKSAQHEEHGCPGHAFGHLGGAVSPGTLAIAKAASEAIRSDARTMRSLTWDGQERPPEFFPLAATGSGQPGAVRVAAHAASAPRRENLRCLRRGVRRGRRSVAVVDTRRAAGRLGRDRQRPHADGHGDHLFRAARCSLGARKQLASAAKRLQVVVPLSLGLIPGLLFMTFGSAKNAALVFSGVPLALTGGVLALWLRGDSS